MLIVKDSDYNVNNMIHLLSFLKKKVKTKPDTRTFTLSLFVYFLVRVFFFFDNQPIIFLKLDETK